MTERAVWIDMRERSGIRKKRIYSIYGILTLLILAGVFLWHFKDKLTALKELYLEESKEDEIDFAYWQKINPDVCAWIRVPGTNIDYPVVQSIAEEDHYYLTHDIYQDENIYGAIFIEKVNDPDFTDPNTVIYGHHMTDGSMFGELTRFEEPDFFREHQEFMIYLPGETLVYEVVAAYRYPAVHLLSVFDFGTEEKTAEYCSQVPGFAVSYGGYAREGEELRAPFVTLSTCTSDNRSFRFLVQGRLAGRFVS